MGAESQAATDEEWHRIMLDEDDTKTNRLHEWSLF
jgi:hypothetical protein